MYHQVKYRLVRAKRSVKSTNGKFAHLRLEASPTKAQALEVREGKWQFRFLNLEKSFAFGHIDWAFRGH